MEQKSEDRSYFNSIMDGLKESLEYSKNDSIILIDQLKNPNKPNKNLKKLFKLEM